MLPTAVVTGTGSGIGCKTCRQLPVQGWRVSALDLSTAALAFLILPSDSRARLVSIACDVRCEESVARAFGEIARAAPAFDALICSAGVLRTASLLSRRRRSTVDGRRSTVDGRHADDPRRRRKRRPVRLRSLRNFAAGAHLYTIRYRRRDLLSARASVELHQRRDDPG